MPNRWTRPTLIALALCASAAPATAEIFRGCRGWITIAAGSAGVMTLAELDTSGFCERVANATQCRERARNRITSCAQALVNDMDGSALPQECQQIRRSDTRVNWFYWGGVDDIPWPSAPPSGYDRVARHACCRPETTMEVVTIGFRAHSAGERGCYRRQRLIGTTFVGPPAELEVNCAAEVARGICGPAPGTAEGPPRPPRPAPTRPRPHRAQTRPAPTARKTRAAARCDPRTDPSPLARQGGLT